MQTTVAIWCDELHVWQVTTVPLIQDRLPCAHCLLEVTHLEHVLYPMKRASMQFPLETE